MSIRLINSLIIIITLTVISACSNNNSHTINKEIKNKGAVKHRVEIQPNIDTPEKEKYLSLLAHWDKETRVKDTITKKTKATDKRLTTSTAKLVVKKRVVKSKSKVNSKPVVKRNVNNGYKTPSFNKPIKNIRYAALSGDYANNKQTQIFINKMVSKHGFDRGYLNYLLSNTEATPFLKKMAYKDSFRPRKSSKKRKVRSGKWNRYKGNFLTEKTIKKGVEFWKNNRVALQRAEQMYGVPQEYILGIIGVETRYGGNVGQNKAIDALAAMGFNNPRRGKYFRSELEAYLLMTRKERLDPLKPMASYAGALGLSQFMPSNIKLYAVDHDRSGSVNLWTPHDAIGSVANYFNKHGWKTGGTVVVPAVSSNTRYKSLKTGFKSSHSLTSLKSRGVSSNQLGNISDKASLIRLNTYSGDELWLGGHNFYVITRYNHSSHYAMAVHQLAEAIDQRINGKSPIRQASIDSILRGLN